MPALSRYFIFLLLIFFTLASCRQHTAPVPVQRAFYYWKSDANYFDSSEVKAVHTLGVKTLFVKFFEVEYDAAMGAMPVAKTEIYPPNTYDSLWPRDINIIPVVFIQTEVLQKTPAGDIDSLAANILFLVRKRFARQFDHEKHGFNEIQVDCDWTASTKEAYFHLLTALKKQYGKKISCTLRLYPYKYPDKMGVPPVDRAMLMCYNLISPTGSNQDNSILSTGELKKYLGRKTVYPLPLDIALPVNSWVLCFHNKRLEGVIHEPDDISSFANPVNALWYQVKKDTLLGDVYLREGDEIKYEKITPAQLMEVTRLLSDKLTIRAGTTVSFFHLDKHILTQYSHETLDRIYNNFR